MAKSRRVKTTVRAPSERLREQADGTDGRPNRPGRRVGERLARPCLGCLLEPWLADGPARLSAAVTRARPAADERQATVATPQAKIPDVARLLGLDVGAGQGGPVGCKDEQPSHRRAVERRGYRLSHAAGTAAPEVAHYIAKGRGHDAPSLRE